tara:strand:- start:5 stop:235 length:231 start_codon:yes stop_codon:yes gene_type:complete
MTTFVEHMIRYESGEMTDAEVVGFFQELVNTGLAWSLQGHYGRTAMALIEAGHISHGGTDEDRIASETDDVLADSE